MRPNDRVQSINAAIYEAMAMGVKQLEARLWPRLSEFVSARLSGARRVGLKRFNALGESTASFGSCTIRGG